jgi:SAM-dependent methyltransferase
MQLPSARPGTAGMSSADPDKARQEDAEREDGEHDKSAQYDTAAEGWSEEQYADSESYLHHRAELVLSLGPRLVAGDTVLDLACGDGGLARPLLDAGLRYVGVDLSHPMVEAARRRVGDRAEIHEADLNEFASAAPVQATTCFRAVYYARDRRAFFRRVAGYTEKKLVFDLNPRQYRVEDVRADLAAAGLGQIELRPFFSPQRFALPGPAAAALRTAERAGPFARLALRYRFSYMVAASRSA